MKPYYEEPSIKLYQEDCPNVMKEMPDESVDLILTDPPYGYSFMGKDWDKAVVRVEIWKECLRVLKSGAFAFVMSAPRQDVLSKMISNLQEAGFDTSFTSVYWAYASGFPKASNIGKMIDKQECKKQLIEKLGRKPTKEEFEKEWENFRKVIGEYDPRSLVDGCNRQERPIGNQQCAPSDTSKLKITNPASLQAKILDGSYGGFQPKPAVEIIIVCMKPLSEKTYVDQALKNKKGITWLDDCRIPYENKDNIIAKNPHTSRRNSREYTKIYGEYQSSDYKLPKGRFPANLLVSDDVLNDGKNISYGKAKISYNYKGKKYKVEGFILDNSPNAPSNYADSGSFSRYFDLDKWAQKTFPFLIVSKASKSEKNKGLKRLKKRDWT